MKEISENRIVSSDSTGKMSSVKTESVYAADFTTFLRNGTVSDTLSRKSDPAGGYLIPESLSEMIAEKLAATNILRRIGHVFHTEGTTRVPVAVGGIDGYWVPEEGQLTLSQPEFSSFVYLAYKLSAMALISCELIHDSAYDLENVLVNSISKRFCRQEENAFLNGDGQDKPTGLLRQIETGAETAEDGVVKMADVVALIRSIASDYRKNGSILMNDNVFMDLFMASDYDHSVWSPGKRFGERMRLLGYPVFTTDCLAETETGAKPILFGDFSYFWIAERSPISIRRLNEKYAQFGQIGFVANERIDAQLVLPDAIKALEVS